MTADYFDRLEAELRAATVRAARPPRRMASFARAGRRRPSAALVGVVLGVAVPLVVGLIFVLSVGDRHRPAPHTPARRHVVHGTPPGGVPGALGQVPTMAQQLANFGVLRRAQTAEDRTYRAPCCEGSVRHAVTLASGYKVYVDLDNGYTPPEISFTVVDAHGSTSSASFNVNVGYTVFPISSGGNNAVWVSIIPDGVATVRWTFACDVPKRLTSRCTGGPPRTFTVPVIDNIAARQVRDADNCGYCSNPQRVVWFSADGRVLATFGHNGSLAGPPFIKGDRGDRVLRPLTPTGIGDASFGEPIASAITRLDDLLGPAAHTNVARGGCGIDHESAWTSPATSAPLIIFARHGRFVGYQYGAPGGGVIMLDGPGARLATQRGLTLGNDVATATRLYRGAFHASKPAASEQGNLWHAATDRGALSGTLIPVFPLTAHASPKSTILTITAGTTGCAS